MALNRKDLNATPAKMEHRHFATIAAIIREMDVTKIARRTTANEFAIKLRATNPNFNRERFIDACMGYDGD